eukprot:CAMPEP_0170557158 /NCGR_PEP_ID=MMETSP0211-20121228/19242_1 /TAXON_ID=311385 /ORGANISM="Pseudokeronopsis sp., Strain OXSARD2" /LENGTH=57 /DNA_ID=CAMNT_0010867903 /DNA_START=25 /DNA_END=198 /DNA_ORIENTATION=+
MENLIFNIFFTWFRLFKKSSEHLEDDIDNGPDLIGDNFTAEGYDDAGRNDHGDGRSK